MDSLQRVKEPQIKGSVLIEIVREYGKPTGMHVDKRERERGCGAGEEDLRIKVFAGERELRDSLCGHLLQLFPLGPHIL